MQAPSLGMDGPGAGPNPGLHAHIPLTQAKFPLLFPILLAHCESDVQEVMKGCLLNIVIFKHLAV
jgi:hypothetical protein